MFNTVKMQYNYLLKKVKRNLPEVLKIHIAMIRCFLKCCFLTAVICVYFDIDRKMCNNHTYSSPTSAHSLTKLPKWWKLKKPLRLIEWGHKSLSKLNLEWTTPLSAPNVTDIRVLSLCASSLAKFSGEMLIKLCWKWQPCRDSVCVLENTLRFGLVPEGWVSQYWYWSCTAEFL